jgi:DNA topoisomerase-3
LRKALDIFHAKFDFFVNNIDRMDVLFGSSFAKLEDVGKPFTRCGKTRYEFFFRSFADTDGTRISLTFLFVLRRYLQMIPGPPARLYNKFTETVDPLPAGGSVKQWTGRKCTVPNCNFELCLYTVGQPPRTFPLCPNCSNSPDWSLKSEGPNATDPVDRADENKERQIRALAGKSLVLECPHPDDHPLIEEMTVSPDPDSDGVFIVDPHLGPKWRLVFFLPEILQSCTFREVSINSRFCPKRMKYSGAI